MKKTNSKLYTDILFTTGVGSIAAFLDYLFNIVLARNLPEYSFGIVSAIVAILYLVFISTTTIQASVTKVVAKYRIFSLHNFRKNTFLKLNKIGILCALVFLLLSPLLSDIMKVELRYLLLVLPMIYLGLVTPLFKGFLLGLQKIKLANFLELVGSGLKLTLVVLVIKLTVQPALPILLYSVPYMIVALIAIFLTRSEKSTEVPPLSLRLNIQDISWIFLGYLMFNLAQTMGTILVKPEFRASLAAVTIIGRTVFFSCTLLGSVMFAHVAKENSKKEQRHIFSRFLLLTLGIVGILSLAYFFLSDTIVNLFVGGNYANISQYVWITGLSMGLYAIAYLILNYLVILGEKKQIIYMSPLLLIYLLLIYFRSNSLQDVMLNQVVTLVLFFIVFIYLYIKDNRSNEKNEIKRNL